MGVGNELAYLLILAIYIVPSLTSITYTGHVRTYTVVGRTVRIRYYTTSCGFWGWGSCGRTAYYTSTHTEYRQRCDTGWIADRSNACIIPVCSVSCKNGGTCVAPNSCICPSTHYGSYCQNSQCSWKFPCYPGICSYGTNCRCTPGFGGAHCGSVISDSQSPTITSCKATMSDRTGSRDHLVAVASCPSNTTIYVKKQDWNHMRVEWTSRYSLTTAPPRPSYIRGILLGIVGGSVHLRWHSQDGRYLFSQTLPCVNGDSESKPNHGISSCSVEYSFPRHSIQHEDRLEVGISSKNGGYKAVFNTDTSSVTNIAITGRDTTKNLTYIFDFEEPKHICRDLGKCADNDSALMIYVAKNGTWPQLEIQWANWVDVTSGIEKYIYTINRGSLQSGSPVYTNKEWRSGSPWPIYTLDTGTYTIILKAVDRAGNEATVIKEINVDDQLQTVSPNMCRSQNCYPGFCAPDTGKCVCTAGFSGDNCNTISGAIQDPTIKTIQIMLSANDSLPFMYENAAEKSNLINLYTNKLDLADLKLTWDAAYRMIGDLPSRPPSVSDFKLGLVSCKAEIEIESVGGGAKKEATLDCLKVDTSLESFVPCSQTHRLSGSRKKRDKLKIVLKASNGGHKIVSGRNVKYQGRTIQRQINIHYDTEAPYYNCAAGSGKCEDEELKVAVGQQKSINEKKILLTLSWGDNWKDALSGIAKFHYFIYTYLSTKEIGLEDAPLANGSWTAGDRFPTYDVKSDKAAFTVVLLVLDKAGNNITVRRDIDLTSPRVAALLGNVPNDKEEDKSGLLTLPILFIILVVAVVVLGVVAVVRRRHGHPWLWKDENLKFWRQKNRRENASASYNNYTYHEDEDQGIYYESEAFGRSVEISSSHIVLGDILCNGHFAIIRHAEWTPDRQNSMAVIAKVLKDANSKADRQLMLDKIEFVGDVPRHENVLAMLGKVTSDLQTGPYMVLEYCRNGSLRDWLLAQKAKGGELSVDTADRMTEYAVQIASGMEHLSNNLIVHKRLMSKNVLLNGRMVAKVMGFGPEGKDAAKNKSRLPTKWMALEILQDPQLKYTTASDVWAFGITLWEIYSLGDIPYPTGHKDKLITVLESGTRPDKPVECPDDIYNQVMLKCMYHDPSKRPSFHQIKNQLNDFFHPPPDDSGMYYGL
ncbi:uncharacterized protein LOC106169714 isoform X1 [Lingula anatina]|uniref:Uncharacterized protein LOC106169714 isoform X1 n=1 Tax=Lingula anatina TaxID=7574 RepID=A0A1S3J2V7_LINAN|nr:uncharacterized protein LOC106169714 isoform X1 [Lingula anatina]|eukprot:XP_013404752.1 uncharacterized protein LOC106169714 isoform X1 [Lingula anatina]